MYKILKIIAFVLVIVGGLNWGLVGLLGFDLVAFLFGDMTLIARLVYSLVGLSAVFLAFAVPICYKQHMKNES